MERRDPASRAGGRQRLELDQPAAQRRRQWNPRKVAEHPAGRGGVHREHLQVSHAVAVEPASRWQKQHKSLEERKSEQHKFEGGGDSSSRSTDTRRG